MCEEKRIFFGPDQLVCDQLVALICLHAKQVPKEFGIEALTNDRCGLCGLLIQMRQSVDPREHQTWDRARHVVLGTLLAGADKLLQK